MAKPTSVSFQKVQDEYLQTETENKGITKLSSLSPVAVIPRAAATDTEPLCGDEAASASGSEHLCEDEAASASGSEHHTDAFLYLWQGDITTLAADAIVNAANSAMTGCYIPNHRCIDNAIHTFAGVQLRLYCHTYMQEQAGKKGASYAEPTGQAMLSPAYNLPSKFILHTVGPIVGDALTEEDCKLLASCYTSCLNLASQHQLESIAFCCISTGEFHFPNDRAAEIAIRTVRDWLSGHPSSTVTKVIFNVFKNEDLAIYRSLLHKT
ncbi:MAG: protein-ADP-ribose hydrolase [Lachnospiraceae bacterium]|nr:protein-ADP-ribose hydrolase [Lachnospiraceae bacterium]